MQKCSFTLSRCCFYDATTSWPPYTVLGFGPTCDWIIAGFLGTSSSCWRFYIFVFSCSWAIFSSLHNFNFPNFSSFLLSFPKFPNFSSFSNFFLFSFSSPYFAKKILFNFQVWGDCLLHYGLENNTCPSYSFKLFWRRPRFLWNTLLSIGSVFSVHQVFFC